MEMENVVRPRFRFRSVVEKSRTLLEVILPKVEGAKRRTIKVE